jgi:hypothetical protein
MAGGGTTAGGSTAMGGSAGSGGGDDLQCPAGSVDCNGQCTAVGATAAGCTVLVAAGDDVEIRHGMALDATHVYWSEQGSHIAVARVARTGGAREEIYETDDVAAQVAVNSTSVVWTENGFNEGRVRVAPKGGGTMTELLLLPDADLADAVATESRVYFSRASFADPSEVVSIPLDGTPGELVHGISANMYGVDIALDTQAVYWLSQDPFGPTEIRKASLTGSDQATLASAESITALAVSGDYVYVSGDGALRRVPVAGGAATDVYRGDEARGQHLVIVGDVIYFGGATAVHRVGTDGSGLTRVLHSSESITRVVADAAGLYAAIATDFDGFVVHVE